jgi:NADH:ubiquinone reductase (non-electrogenic)
LSDGALDATAEGMCVSYVLDADAIMFAMQVARQQGEWLAALFANEALLNGKELPPDTLPFEYKHRGALAYVSQDRAVMDVPVFGALYGPGVGFLWKSFETYSQFSFRNKLLVSLDWLRTRMFGRDISRV